MRRRVWAWPVGIVGNVLLFTVFFGVAFANAAAGSRCYGQAGRQVFFIITSVYGWWRWRQTAAAAASWRDAPAVAPRWATARGAVGVPRVLAVGRSWSSCSGVLRDRCRLAGAAVVLLVPTPGSSSARSSRPTRWPAAGSTSGWPGSRWTSSGSRCCCTSGFYPSAVLYAVYGALVLCGFFVWLRVVPRRERPPTASRARWRHEHAWPSIDPRRSPTLARGPAGLVVDDEDRENEGDVILAAAKATPELAGVHDPPHLGRGLRADARRGCPTGSRCRPWSPDNEDPRGTAYTVSVDARDGVRPASSAADRARTHAAAGRPRHRAADLARPGHVFPLRARAGGVLQRAGHTEAAVDLCRAGRADAGGRDRRAGATTTAR